MSRKPKMSEILDVKGDAIDISRLREKTEAQFDYFEDLKQKYRTAIISSDEFLKDDKLTGADVDEAVEKKFANIYAFRPPKDNLGTKFARSYVRRRIWVPKVIRTVTVASVIALSAVGINSVRLKIAENAVEVAVEKSYQTKQSLEGQIHNLVTHQEILSNAGDLKGLIRASEDTLSTTNDFFLNFCSDGTASDDINQENYKEAKQQLQAINEVLNSVEAKIVQGNGIVRFEQDLISTKQGLDSLIAEIMTSHPPDVLQTRAEAAYNSGIASIDNRQLDEGKNYVQQLKTIKSDVKQFEILPLQLEQLYSAITEIAKEDLAIQKSDELHKEGVNYVNTVDVANLNLVVTNLQNLNTVLNQEYTVKIVTRPGVKSGMDRYYTDSNGKRSSGFYLIVEALDGNSNALSMDITSEETGRTETVNMWGERIPNSVYEKVKQDKIDDGIIQKNLFSKKARGYLSEELLIQGVTERAQITRW